MDAYRSRTPNCLASLSCTKLLTANYCTLVNVPVIVVQVIVVGPELCVWAWGKVLFGVSPLLHHPNTNTQELATWVQGQGVCWD